MYPIFICTYPVERIKPAAIALIYSKKEQGPLVGIAPVIEEKRPSKVKKEWSFQDESLDHSHPFATNVWYKYVAQAARQAKHSDCFVCSHMPHSTSQPIAYATPMNITSAECAFNVSMFNASTAQCTHTPLFNPGEGKPPGLKAMTQHHSQRCLGQDQPKLHPLCVERESFKDSQDAGSVPAQWCCQVIKTNDPPLVPVLDGVWWLCGRRTYPYLYSTWHGRCAPVTVSNHTYVVYGEAT